MWRPEWKAQRSGACAVSRVVVATLEPHRTAALFHAPFGSTAVAESGWLVVFAGSARIELASPAAVAEEFDDAAADPAGRREYLAAAAFKVASLPETGRLLRLTKGLRVEGHRVVVPAAAAFNTTLVFTE